MVMVFHVTFSNISVISWLSVLLVEEAEDPEKTTNMLQVTDKLYHTSVIFSSLHSTIGATMLFFLLFIRPLV
jgi:hypothetical protein